MLYFNVIRNLIKENTHCIFENGPMKIYEGCDLPEDLDELCVVKISTNRGGILIFECC